MSRTPNAEQQKAIQMDGGLLLQAGAGSGKTFVIIEHVIHKIQKWIEEYSNLDIQSDDFSRYMKNKLSSMVLMTFTNLAAGEMAIRLEARIKELVSQAEGLDQERWEEVFRLSHMMTITTIHGFCYKLIRQGFFKNINVDSKLINEDVLRLFVKDNLSSWLVKNLTDQSIPRNMLDKVLLQRQMFINALMNIVKDSVVMHLWDHGNNQKELNIWESLCLYHSKPQTFENENLTEFMTTKWAPFLGEFQSTFPTLPSSEEEFKKIFHFFLALDFKIPTARFAKNVPEEIKDKYIGLKNLKDFFKKQSEHFLNFWEESKTCNEWDQLFGKVVRNLLDSYHQTNFMTFTDMEYKVWQALQDVESQSRVASRYEYLIVDEFQDTSKMQFEIIANTVAGDFQKLFLVGDLKQAIYGFRGGEISVFKQCQQQMPHVHALKTNYRSSTSIIDFNNRFFSNLFLRNFRQEEFQDQLVIAEDQLPGDKASMGKITLVRGHLNQLLGDEVEALASSDVEKIEAALIRNYIEKLKQEPDPDIAVLYRKLAPSKYLIDELAAHGIGFSTQVKIVLNEDPILAIFKILMEGLLDTGGKHFAYSSLVIDSLLNQLDVKSACNHPEQIQTFYNNTRYFGLKNAFIVFLQNLHLSIPNYKDSIGIIDQVIEHNGGDIEAVYVSLGEMLQKSYSLVLKFGSQSDDVTIMTTHASKGLQFGKVIVAGIYTNDHFRPNTDLIGKIPKSFQWAPSEMAKDKYKTPYFIWENENTKRREFHESKRLFYVACTRAENELIFVDLKFGEIKMKKSSANSWANLLSEWINEDSLDYHLVEVEDPIDFSIHPEIELPLFHSNSLGIVSKEGQNYNCAVMPELSATRLITAANCPKKFYFQNICKFDEGKSFFQLKDEMEIDELQGPLSSMKRGIEIHEAISRFINSGFSNIHLNDSKSSGHLSWLAQTLAPKYQTSKLISEKLIKFSFFGHMMTAIPDLYILDNATNLPIEVWDFKTGNQDDQKDVSYFLQLQVYVGALAAIYGLADDHKIKIVICYIDQQKLLEQTVSVEETKKELNQLWRKTQKPWVENSEHCHSCGYKPICQV